MQESSIFGNRTPGDCRKQVHGPVVIYDGSVATVPTIVNGVLIFGGGLATELSRGIGYNGALAADNSFRINYDSILNGGSGVRIRTSLDPLKKKVRLTCATTPCGGKTETLSFYIYKVQTCESPGTQWDSWTAPIDVSFECSCLETCCQRLSRLASIINANPDYPVVATVTNIGTVYYVDLESKVAGVDFHIRGRQGLDEPKVIVPYGQQSFTAYEVAAWTNQSIALLNTTPTKKMTVVEIYYMDQLPTTHAAGTATSNPDGDIYEFINVRTIARIVFDEATANSNTAFTTLKTLLAGTNAYNKKIDVTTSVDANYYRYLIVRTDAGDAAALTTVRTDYTTGRIQLDRSAYQAGKSYYTLLSSSATPPAAVGSDVVTLGQFTPGDLPAIADGCPVPENSICLSC